MGGRGASSSIAKSGGGGKYSQAYLEEMYNSVDTQWDMTLNERYELAEVFTKEVANKNNFFENSVGFWEKARKPKGEPDHTSVNKRTGEVSSEYWYTKEGVYRRSNHWGSDVASCSWYINGRKYGNDGVQKGRTETAFIPWNKLKAKGMVGKNHKDGKYSTIGFKFKK